MNGLARRALLALAWLAIIPAAEARRLPIQVYTTAQGMPRNTAMCMVPDPSGLLWICTSEGLARFDGSEFRTFGVEQGLPAQAAIDFLIARDGSYWVLTTAGLCRLPAGAKTGTQCRVLDMPPGFGSQNVDSLVEKSDGSVWMITTSGLYRASSDHARLDLAVTAPEGRIFETLGRGPGDTLLVGSSLGIFLWNGAQLQELTNAAREKCGFGVIHYASDSDIWVPTSCGLYRLAGSLDRGDLRVEPALLSGSKTVIAQSVVRKRDGTLWMASPPGLVRAENQGSRLEFAEKFGNDEGVPYQWITRLIEDAQGNLWGSVEGLGIFRATASGFQIYAEGDGLGNPRISSIFEDLRGDLCVTTSPESATAAPGHLKVKTGDRFEKVELQPPAGFTGWGWGWNQIGLQSHDGEWWFPASSGLYRYRSAATPLALRGLAPVVYSKDAVGGLDGFFRLFEDSHGDLWMTSVSRQFLIRWERATGRFRRFTSADGWPSGTSATAIRESASGTLWISTFDEVLRLRGGRLEVVDVAAGRGFSPVRDLYIDSADRLWIATANSGVYRCDRPDTDRPKFQRYTAKEGLSTASTRSLTEDNNGFIYVGTVRAVDRIDPRAAVNGGNVRHYTAADGLPDGEQSVAFRDRRGHLWFGTLHGLAEFDPAAELPHPLPRVYIRRVRVRGEEVPLPWAGTDHLPLDLAADKNQIEIEYAAADLRAASAVRYQYRLQGVDSDWSAVSTRSSVNYESMPPGTRNFEVRAVGAAGELGQNVAGIAMALAAPLWRQWWFLLSAALSIGVLGYWLYDYRVRHLLALERLRTRIATDLHDDIGSSLTQISLLSEMGQRSASRNVLGEIAQISRDLAREMSDIVWAVSPRHDRFDALAHRMRRFAEDALPNGEVIFDTAGLPGDLSLPIEYRRPLFLVFKEAVNNVARHSGASRMTVRLAVVGGVFRMAVEDSGSGFDVNSKSPGEGLNNILRRLRDLGGEGKWETERGSGTRFTATIPLRR